MGSYRKLPHSKVASLKYCFCYFDQYLILKREEISVAIETLMSPRLNGGWSYKSFFLSSCNWLYVVLSVIQRYLNCIQITPGLFFRQKPNIPVLGYPSTSQLQGKEGENKARNAKSKKSFWKCIMQMRSSRMMNYWSLFIARVLIRARHLTLFLMGND